MVRKSLAAGILIALGGWIYLSVPDKIIGAFLFKCLEKNKKLMNNYILE